MWIAVGSLLLTFSIFLNCIELIKTEPRTLEDLYPGFSGTMPLLDGFHYEENRYRIFQSLRQIEKFEKFGDRTMLNVADVVFRRAHILFGWDYNGQEIQNLCRLFPHLENVFIVFDISQDKWHTIPRNLAEQLGVGRHVELVIARDEVAIQHIPPSDHRVHTEAHIRACRQANEWADSVERDQVRLLAARQTSYTNSCLAIKQAYSREYDRAFALHLRVNQHEEFNIHGKRGRNV